MICLFINRQNGEKQFNWWCFYISLTANSWNNEFKWKRVSSCWKEPQKYRKSFPSVWGRTRFPRVVRRKLYFAYEPSIFVVFQLDKLKHLSWTSAFIIISEWWWKVYTVLGQILYHFSRQKWGFEVRFFESRKFNLGNVEEENYSEFQLKDINWQVSGNIPPASGFRKKSYNINF